MTLKPEHLLSAGNIIGEAPLWVPEEGVLYWTDTETNSVWSLCLGREGSGNPSLLRNWRLTLPVTAIHRQEEEGFLLVTKKGLALWDSGENLCDLIANPLAGCNELSFNDGALDRQGRLVTGTMNHIHHVKPDGELYRMDGDLTLTRLDRNLSVANGIGFSPDGKTMYVSEQFKGRILSYDYDPPAGTLSGRREFARLSETEGLPDGITVDAEGFIWNCHWGGGLITRYSPDGKRDLQIRMPVPIVACLAFGGEDLSELYVTTGCYGMGEKEKSRNPGSGDLFRIKTPFRGLFEPRFRREERRGN